jgi:hypothetical protein
MSSRADLPELIGFFSYSREDDEAFEGTLSALRNGIQRELSAQLGRSKQTFRLRQDQEAMAPGKAEAQSAWWPHAQRQKVGTHQFAANSSSYLSRFRQPANT